MSIESDNENSIESDNENKDNIEINIENDNYEEFVRLNGIARLHSQDEIKNYIYNKDFMKNILDLHIQNDQIIFEGDWNNITQIKLYEIKDYALDREQIHLIIRDYYYKCKYFLHIPTIVFNTITVSLIAFQEDNTSSFKIYKTASIITSSISTILSSIITFFNFAELGVNHNSAANEYRNLANYIDQFIYLPVHKRPDCQVIIENTRHKISAILRSECYVPRYFVKKYYTEKFNK